MYRLDLIRPISTRDLVRMGIDQDGGYVLNKRIAEQSSVLLSFGIGTDWTFENDFLSLKKGKPFQLLAYDFSVGIPHYLSLSYRYIKHMFSSGHKWMDFLGGLYFIRHTLRFIRFVSRPNVRFLKKGIDHVSSEKFLTFEEVFRKYGNPEYEKKIFVKIDVEGYEFQVLEDMLRFADKISGFVCEFHELEKNGHLFEELILAIRHAGFVITHIHPNNWGGVIAHTNLPRYLEISFGHKDLFSATELSVPGSMQYPKEGLDYPCVRNMPELSLVFD